MTERPDYAQLDMMNANEKVDFELLMANRTDLNYRSDKGAIMRILSNANALMLTVPVDWLHYLRMYSNP
ncbi:hypothetical protein KUH03_10305 [Sphingobacterium sp. E70]|uniref:hypothetical protein n=1 Tax=Sphingobacterium sp. E70 TaxID=2853439 RepID=UPI00211C6046|nr:hypothetical protein [Sphingobacterium sp. E70]ULT27125.1 hypothetical protein KUH03_10305 [Sphingobacterium sp. E70]